jgi:hypothetical protein
MAQSIAKKSDYTYQEARDLTDRIKDAMRFKPVAPKRRKVDPDRPAELYRCFAEDGSLLYVGISVSAASRMGQHKGYSGWWRLVARIEVEHYQTRTAAREAELEAIRTESPAYNREGAL